MNQAYPESKSIKQKVIEKLEIRLRMKMVNARVKTFIRNHYEKHLRDKGATSQGSFTLRDDLYALARSKTSKSSTPGNPSKK